MKTIIAKNYQKEKILHDLAKHNNGVIKDTQVLSLESALHEGTNDHLDLLLQLSRRLRMNGDNYPIYGGMFCFPDFFDEIIEFTKTCILWGVDSKSLPEDNTNEKELKEIITVAFDLHFAEKDIVKNQAKMIKKLEGETIELYPSFYRDVYHYNLFHKLKAMPNVTLMQDEHSKTNPDFQLRYALNSRQELESIAQDICKTNNPCNIILPSYSNLYPVLKQIFKRYGIPYSSVKDTPYCHIGLVFSSLLSYTHSKNKETFLKLLQNDCFATKCPQDVYDYLERQMVDCKIPSPIAEKIKDLKVLNDYKYLEPVEKAVNEFIQQIHDDLELLNQSSNAQSMLENAYAVMQKSPYLHQQHELELAFKIHAEIQYVGSSVQTEDISLVIPFFEKIVLQTHDYNNDFCVVTDLTHPVTPRENCYIVCCDGTSYPGFPSCKGLFDENYVQKLQNYPSLHDRNVAYMKQLNWINNSATNTIYYSYPTNDYEGREIGVAYEIESLFPSNSALLWPLDVYKNPRKVEHVLTPDSAVDLFTTNGNIYGSITSIEKWFKCPYSYFLEKGLKIKKTFISKSNSLFIGNVQHKVMENVTNTAIANNHPKTYALFSEDEIKKTIEPYFKSLMLLYPNDVSLFAVTCKRLIANLKTNLNYLSDAQIHSSFEPSSVEQVFSDFEIVDNVILNGVIDRIDKYQNKICIIDYKSSLHDLTEKNVASGQQLQLLTYCIVAESQQLDPVGVFYYSISIPNSEKQIGFIVNNMVAQDTLFDNLTFKGMVKNKMKYSGWYFENTDDFDGGNHVKGKKDNVDYLEKKEQMEDIYSYFKEQLLVHSNIQLNPVDRACIYCGYKSICQFNGQYRIVKPICSKQNPSNVNTALPTNNTDDENKKEVR